MVNDNKNLTKLNSNISELYKLRNEYLKIHKNIKKNKLTKINKTFSKNSDIIYKHMMHNYKILSIKEYDETLSFYVEPHNPKCNLRGFNLEIPIKYKHLNPIPFIILHFKRFFTNYAIEYQHTDLNELEDTFFYRGAFLLSNGQIYSENFMKPSKIYKNLYCYLHERFRVRIKHCYKRVFPFYTCNSCKENKNTIDMLELFYEILSFQISKSKGYTPVCCKFSKDNAARIIQKNVLHWLYSAPNGYFFKKGLKELQGIGIIN